MDLSAHPLCVAVFHRPDCPACTEFLPRARAVAQRWPCVPTALLSTETNGPMSDALMVYATPTTFVLRHGRIEHRIEGAASEAEVEALYRRVAGECKR